MRLNMISFDSELSLVGLCSGGSIPLGIACLGGLLTFLGLSALHFFSERPQEPRGKEVTMKQMGQTRSFDWYRVTKPFTSTAWTIGTGMLAGALPG